MAVTEGQFTILFPQYVGDGRNASFLALSESRVSSDVFGDLYDNAVYFLTAHVLTQMDRAGSGGASGTNGAIREKVGDVEVGYSAELMSGGSSDTSDLMTTPFGRQFLALLKLVRPTPCVLNA